MIIGERRLWAPRVGTTGDNQGDNRVRPGGWGLTSLPPPQGRGLTPQGVGPHRRRLRPALGIHSEARGYPYLPPPWGYYLAHSIQTEN